MATQERVEHLRKFFPPSAAVKPYDILKAKGQLPRGRGAARAPGAVPSVGVLSTHGLVFRPTLPAQLEQKASDVHKDADGNAIDCGCFVCVACNDEVARTGTLTNQGSIALTKAIREHYHSKHPQQV